MRRRGREAMRRWGWRRGGACSQQWNLLYTYISVVSVCAHRRGEVAQVWQRSVARCGARQDCWRRGHRDHAMVSLVIVCRINSELQDTTCVVGLHVRRIAISADFSDTAATAHAQARVCEHEALRRQRETECSLGWCGHGGDARCCEMLLFGSDSSGGCSCSLEAALKPGESSIPKLFSARQSTCAIAIATAARPTSRRGGRG